MNQKVGSSKKKAAKPGATSESIAAQTEKFLKTGGVVQEVSSGRGAHKAVSAS